jgi:hypothetical protein
MLVLFAFSGTPKKFIHDLVVSHKDTRSKYASDARTSVQRSFFNCHIEDLVVESPFIEETAPTLSPAQVVFIDTYAQPTTRLYAIFPVSTSLRGPPALI